MQRDQEPDERRRFSRINFEATVDVISAGQRWKSVLIDISLKGALLQLPSDFEARANHEYQVEISLDNGEQIIMDTQLAHQRDDCIGFACNRIGMDSFTRLKRLVELNLGDPDLLNRELSALG